MRLSLGSVGALTAALLVAFAFWPDSRAVRGPELVVAQDKPKARDAKSITTAAPREKASNEPRATDKHAAQPCGRSFSSQSRSTTRSVPTSFTGQQTRRESRQR
jgi:hypothetical protein